jgi:hypothetical protein
MLLAGVTAATMVGPASAIQTSQASANLKVFNHVGTFNVPDNLLPAEDIATPTSAEIADHALHGTVLLYTDALTGRLAFVNNANAAAPVADGTIDVDGSPTSVAVAGKWALVLVDTSEDFVNPSGRLLVVDVQTRSVVRTVELAGQPDSIALGPNNRFAAIVIENQRDEDLDDGLITPAQVPAGSLQILELRNPSPAKWTLRTVDLTGLADFAPDDPEPEYVDVNSRNEAVVSLQENNHFVIVNLVSGSVVNDFPAGSVTLVDVDATEDDLGPQGAGIIELGELIVKRREPDAVHWIDDDTFASANEGDYDDGDEEGGSRGFTFFNTSGAVEFESGSSFEQWIVRAGHYPEARSENKGNEPEGLEVAYFGARKLLFVGAERANVVGVYDITSGTPVPLQLLATGIGPEGIKAIPGRDLLAVSSEVDGPAEGFAVRSIVTLYRLKAWPLAYPQLVSADEGGLPIPWVAISGLAGDPHDANTVWAVSDSALAQAYVYRIDVSGAPALIEERIPVGAVDVDDQHDGDFDLEGIAARPEGGFWLASEGRTNAGSSRPNLILRTDAAGTILDSVDLAAGLVAGATSSGLEGIAVTGTEAGGDEVVWAAFQREWADDPAGLVKIGRYEVATGTWTFAHYPLDPEAPGTQIGLSEITLLPDGHTAAIIERDDQIALDAQVKRIYGVDLTSVTFAPFGGPLPVLAKTLLRDVLDDLDDRSISVPDKLEGLAITAAGQVFLATDNDGVDENYGETLFFGLGPVARAFGL